MRKLSGLAVVVMFILSGVALRAEAQAPICSTGTIIDGQPVEWVTYETPLLAYNNDGAVPSSDKTATQVINGTSLTDGLEYRAYLPLGSVAVRWSFWSGSGGGSGWKDVYFGLNNHNSLLKMTVAGQVYSRTLQYSGLNNTDYVAVMPTNKAGDSNWTSYIRLFEVAQPCEDAPTPTPTPELPTPTPELPALSCADYSFTIPQNLDNVQFTIPSGYDLMEILGFSNSGYVTGDVSLNLPHGAAFDYTVGVPVAGGTATLVGQFQQDTQIGFCTVDTGTPVPTVAPTFTPNPSYTPTPSTRPTPTNVFGGGVVGGGGVVFDGTPNDAAMDLFATLAAFLQAMGIYNLYVAAIYAVVVVSLAFFIIKLMA